MGGFADRKLNCKRKKPKRDPDFYCYFSPYASVPFFLKHCKGLFKLETP